MNERMRLLPLIDKERTRLSITLWNASKWERDMLKPRERAEAWRRLKNAAVKFGLELEVER